MVEKAVVAVKASKEIPKTALIWALTHVVQPGDCITLLVVVPSQNSGKRLWGFPRLPGDCANGNKRSHTGTASDQKDDLTDTCSQMILQLHDVYNPNKINVKIKIVSGSPCGVVAAEAKKEQANWVILDKHLKQEEKRCVEELQCNIATMKKHSQPKVLRLNLVGTRSNESKAACMSLSSNLDDNNKQQQQLQQPKKEKEKENDQDMDSIRCPAVTPVSSPELFTATEAGTSSVSSSDPGTSPFSVLEISSGGHLKIEEEEVEASRTSKHIQDFEEDDSETETETESENLSQRYHHQPWMASILASAHHESFHNVTTKTLLEKFSKLEHDADSRPASFRTDTNMSSNGNMRNTTYLSINTPLEPPPLCSVCQHKAPLFGKPPRWFTYAELELATGGFSRDNFLAEGGYGNVHRGILPSGQVVAVKQHKLASSQGDQEFCAEVEVLSCAQHRNVVMLIGFCIEEGRRLLVYEYICNGSLDSHLYGRQREPFGWSARQKIAVGAARGLRYLHEECRVGCIVHRDMRPNNILITHDFEPLVGDFGLARWQPDGDTAVETRVIGTFGYLAPEYTQSGQITEKADVYSFGVVLVELVTGRKAVDINRPRGQQCLTEWARPLLEEYAIDELVDPCLVNNYDEQEVYYMLHAASLCIRRDPQSRPRMSQVLRILEGDGIMDSGRMDVGSLSGRVRLDDDAAATMEGGFSGKLQKPWQMEIGRRIVSYRDDNDEEEDYK
ncbi:inactive protein kinase SELMODRAFT_444075-like [Impatiens glandulifera]|uniref:inactive protein kinase SELMODRAFT_444075-like n=1 Tax=Impatiens glandulifera TaxID=253017 RepID=UPI001FB0C405|nr:inactive protein kinase SELMODRAFT_444075-like [Impatiens glandulifera]XP_047316998.1 inactive protein kinase SELMODRAFT_444075-like [Impatiens glandulifera]XP_047316999.1 inactive protein kinase SELMODRAFT_444075-like [Impatiens glandulifera]